MPDNRFPMAGALTIQRGIFRDAGTFGKAWLDDGGPPFDSLEPPNRRNQPGSCIPAGVYRAYTHRKHRAADPWLWAASRVNVYELQDVPGRSHVEIDVGQWAGDLAAGLYFDLHGLIALGSGFATVQPPRADCAPQIALLQSDATMAVFTHRTQGYGITVRIIDPE
jgi:Family of unknown function (DUF5675)